MTTTYIYGLIDPRNNEVKYVGKAKKPSARLVSHMSEYTNNGKRQWLEELKQCNLKPILHILDEAQDEDWATKEKYWIKKLKSDGCELFNILAGGQGRRSSTVSVGMKLNDPIKIKTLLAKEKEWVTVGEIATGLGLHQNTVRKMFRKENVDPETVRTLAHALNKNVVEIAVFVQ